MFSGWVDGFTMIKAACVFVFIISLLVLVSLLLVLNERDLNPDVNRRRRRLMTILGVFGLAACVWGIDVSRRYLMHRGFARGVEAGVAVGEALAQDAMVENITVAKNGFVTIQLTLIEQALRNTRVATDDGATRLEEVRRRLEELRIAQEAPLIIPTVDGEYGVICPYPQLLFPVEKSVLEANRERARLRAQDAIEALRLSLPEIARYGEWLHDARTSGVGQLK